MSYRMLGLLGILSLFLSFGCAKKDFPLPDHPGGRLFNGAARGDIRCYRCHGDVGKGSSRAPTLVHPGQPIDKEMFVKTVLNGRGRMPSFGSALAESDVLQIIDWLEKASGSADSPQGK